MEKSHPPTFYTSSLTSPSEQRGFPAINWKFILISGGPVSALILDGTKIAAQIRAEVGAEVRQMTAAGLRPGLAVVLVGHNPASEIYVRSKVKACEELGILSEKHPPPESASTEELLALVDDLNRRNDIDGILVQFPLPGHVDSKKVLLAVSPAKDVDGFHPMNVGYLSTQRPGVGACPPGGGGANFER